MATDRSTTIAGSYSARAILVALAVCVTFRGFGRRAGASAPRSPAYTDSISRGDLASLKSSLPGLSAAERNAALMLAIRKGNVGAISLLLDGGADANFEEEGGFTPLAVGIMGKNMDVVQLLLRRGANVEAKDAGEVSPLELAAEGGAVDLMKALIKAGANPNGPGKGRPESPIDHAAAEGQAGAIHVLAKAGANVNANSSNGMAPIQWALAGHYWAAVEALIDEGADPNVADRTNGFTPLHQAALELNVEAVRYLVAHGANRDAKTKAGRAPLDEAMKNPGDPKAKEIIEILRGTKTS